MRSFLTASNSQISKTHFLVSLDDRAFANDSSFSDFFPSCWVFDVFMESFFLLILYRVFIFIGKLGEKLFGKSFQQNIHEHVKVAEWKWGLWWRRGGKWKQKPEICRQIASESSKGKKTEEIFDCKKLKEEDRIFPERERENKLKINLLTNFNGIHVLHLSRDRSFSHTIFFTFHKTEFNFFLFYISRDEKSRFLTLLCAISRLRFFIHSFFFKPSEILQIFTFLLKIFKKFIFLFGFFNF
jgi:hypothetical protein